MVLTPLIQMMTVPFSAGNVRVEVKLPLFTPTGCIRKFPDITSLLPGTRVISPSENLQKIAVPGIVH